MTTYAPNFTPRMRVKYLAAGVEHTIQMRSSRGASSVTVDASKEEISNIFQLFEPLLAEDFAFLSAEYALTDSDVFIPTSLPTAVTGEQLLTDFSLQQRATSTGFIGRSAGSRAAIFFYGIWWEDGVGTPRDNGRVTTVENTAIGSAAANLSTNAKAGSGGDAVFYTYANIKVNDHILKLIRRGAIS